MRKFPRPRQPQVSFSSRALACVIAGALASVLTACQSASPASDFDRVRGEVIAGQGPDSVALSEPRVTPGTIALQHAGVTDAADR